MQEKIGNFTLDYTYYPGEDLYSDGEIEDVMLSIVKDHSKEEYRSIIENSGSWPILYHLSDLRGNIVEWLPMDKNTKVLEIGSGCGAITSTLVEKAGHITCVDLSKKRSLMNAYRNKDKGNVTIHLGNFQDIEPTLPCDYDYVLLIGVFEYAQGYIGGEKPYEEFMRILNRHCKKDGRLVIAIENKFGLKYWAGCREDHAGTYFEGLENYPNQGGARTFTRRGLEEIMKAVGIEEYHFYYPYPDYKFPHTIYSDERLPKVGELSTNIRNYDRERMLLFNETAVFNSVIEESEFPLFSNSYMVVTGKRPEITYSKYSNERADRFAIRTDYLQEEKEKTTVIRKHPLKKEAKKHTEKIEEIYQKLTQKYKESGLVINACKEMENGDLYFDFAKGVSLEELLENTILRNDVESFRKYILEYKRLLEYNADFEVVDYDFIFQNILVDDSNWTLIDYEWTYEDNIPAKEIAFRAWYCFSMGSKLRGTFEKDWYFDLFKITKQDEESLMAREAAYQKEVTDQHMALGEIRDKIGNAVISPMEGEKVRVGGEDLKYKIQIYPDCGAGFSEDTAFFLPRAYTSENEMEFSFELPANCQNVRIDPCMFSCMITIKELAIDGKQIKIKKKMSNGKQIGDNSFLFATNDPGFQVKCPKDAKVLSAKIDVVRLDEGVAARI